MNEDEEFLERLNTYWLRVRDNTAPWLKHRDYTIMDEEEQAALAKRMQQYNQELTQAKATTGKTALNQAEYNALLILRRYLESSITYDEALLQLWNNLDTYSLKKI